MEVEVEGGGVVERFRIEVTPTCSSYIHRARGGTCKQ